MGAGCVTVMGFLESSRWRWVLRSRTSEIRGLGTKFVVFFLRCYRNPWFAIIIPLIVVGYSVVAGLLFKWIVDLARNPQAT